MNRASSLAKGKWFSLLAPLCLAAISQGVQAAEPGKQVTLKCAFYQPVGHAIFELGKESLSKVEAATGGRVKIVPYPSSTLVPTAEMAAGVDDGTAFCANWYMPYMSKTIPLFKIETLPIWTSGDMQSVLNAYNEGINDLYTEALHRQGLKNTKVAGLSEALWRVLGTKKPVRVPGDVKGVKIRTVGAEADMLKAMGASPINVTNDQTYEALSRGIAEGATNSFMMFEERGYFEHVKYVSELNVMPVLMHIIYNTKELEKLEPRDRPVVEKAMKDLAKHTLDGLARKNEASIKTAPTKYGVQLVPLKAEERALWFKGAASVNQDFAKLQDPLVQKALAIVYKTNPPK